MGDSNNNCFCLFRSLNIDHLVSMSQEFKNEVQMWYSSSPQQLLQCTGSSTPTGHFYGFCSMNSTFLHGNVIKAVVKFPGITLAIGKVKGELCQCSARSSCCNQRALKALRDRGGTPPTFQGLVASNLTPPKSPGTDDCEILDVTPDDVQRANAFRATLMTKPVIQRPCLPVQKRANGHSSLTPKQKELLAHIQMLNGKARRNETGPPAVPLEQPQKQRQVMVQGVPQLSRPSQPMLHRSPLPPSVVPQGRQQPSGVGRAEQQLQHQLQKARVELQLQQQLQKNNTSRAIPVVQPPPKNLTVFPPHLVGRNAIQPTSSAPLDLASALSQINADISPIRDSPILPSSPAPQLGNGTIRAALRGPGKRMPPIRSRIPVQAGVQTVKMAVMQNLAAQNKALAQMSMPGCSLSLPGPSTTPNQTFSVAAAPQKFDLPVGGSGRRGGYKRMRADDDDYAPDNVMQTGSNVFSTASFRPKRSCTQVARSIHSVDNEPVANKKRGSKEEDEEDSEAVFDFLRYRKDVWKEYDLKKQMAKMEPNAEEIGRYDISVCKQCKGWVPKREHRNHVLELHGDQKRFRCADDDCDFQTMYYQKGQQHLKKHNFTTRVFDWKMDSSFRAYGNALIKKCFPSNRSLPVRHSSLRVIKFTTAITGDRKETPELEEPSFQDISGPWFQFV